MQRETRSLVLACVVGSFVGAACALEISQRLDFGKHLAILGMLFGGALAYCIVDFRSLIAGMRRAFRRTVEWRPSVPFWTANGYLHLVMLSIITPWIIVAALFFTWLYDIANKGDLDLSAAVYCRVAAGIFAMVHLITSLVGFCVYKQHKYEFRERWELDIKRDIANCRVDIRKHNALRVMKNMLDHMFRETYSLAKEMYVILATIPQWPRRIASGLVSAWHTIKTIAKGICNFVWHFFLYVHTTRRTICFVDAALGAAIGYTCGSPIIGSLAGGLLGLINYELVTIRFLRPRGLIPQVQ